MRFTITSLIAAAVALTPSATATPVSPRQEALKPFEVTATTYSAPNGRPGTYPCTPSPPLSFPTTLTPTPGITVRANVTDPNSYTFTSGSTVGTVPAGISGLNCLAQWYPNEYAEGRSYPCDPATKGHWVMQTLAGDEGLFSGSNFKLRFIHVVEPGQLIQEFRGRVEGEAVFKAGINGTTRYSCSASGSCGASLRDEVKPLLVPVTRTL
jgi:hypothetical protein